MSQPTRFGADNPLVLSGSRWKACTWVAISRDRIAANSCPWWWAV